MIKKPKKEKILFSLKNAESIKKFANNEEKKFAKESGTIRTPASGATTFLKGDSLDSSNMYDLKSTKNSQIIVTVDMLRKLEKDAFRMGKNPVLVLNFVGKNKLTNSKWYLITKG